MKRLFLIVWVTLVGLTACTENVESQVEIDTPQLSISETIGEEKITFTSSVDWSLEISDTKGSADWLSVPITSGKAGTFTLTVRIQANDTYDDRIAYILITAGDQTRSITVSQSRKKVILLSEREHIVQAQDTLLQIGLQHNVEYDIVLPNVDWITQTQSKALEAHQFSFAITANPDLIERRGKIIFKDKQSALSDTVIITQQANSPSQVPIKLEISVLPMGNQSTTKADLGADENKVNNVWLLQFNESDGIRNGNPIYVTTGINQTDNDVSLSALLMTASTPQIIYVIANTGDAMLFNESNAPANISALNDRSMIFTESQPIASTGLLMLGIKEVFSVTSRDEISVEMERMYAKVTLNYTVAPSFAGFEVTGVKLRNIAQNSYYRSAPIGLANYPEKDVNSHLDISAIVSGTSGSYTWYIPENLRKATAPINSLGNRILGNTDGCATYIEITGLYTDDTQSLRITYSLLLGDVGTSLNDFNVERNHAFPVDLTINGYNSTDGRITVTPID